MFGIKHAVWTLDMPIQHAKHMHWVCTIQMVISVRTSLVSCTELLQMSTCALNFPVELHIITTGSNPNLPYLQWDNSLWLINWIKYSTFYCHVLEMCLTRFKRFPNKQQITLKKSEKLCVGTAQTRSMEPCLLSCM